MLPIGSARPRSSGAPLALGLLLAAASCASPGRPPAPAGAPVPAAAAAAGRTVTILAINDVYRIEGVDAGAHGGIARVRTLRARLEEQAPDMLFLHAGDLLFPSLLSHTYGGEQMVDVLNLLDGDPGFDERMVAVFGNHEFDKAALADAALVDRRVEQSEFLWLDTNIAWKSGEDGEPLVAADNLFPTVIRESGGVTVGIFGLTTDLKHPQYVESFGDPVAVARRATADLRSRGAELVIGLTHLRLSQDLALLEALGADGPDLILGGHEHNCLVGEAGGRLVIKADAEARTATVARVTVGDDGRVTVAREFRTLGPEVEEDPAVRAAVDAWLEKHDREYCRDVLNTAPGCLAETLGSTRVTLVGEELEIRRFETNLGDWVVDRALEAYASEGAQVAFVNSGSLRLNQDVPAGTALTRRHVEELFPYPAGLRLLKISGRDLQAAVSHAVEDWTGNGWWLQVAGMSFRHDPDAGTATELSLLTPAGPRPVAPDDEILAVTSDFLVQGNDGYTMFDPGRIVPGSPAYDLKQLVIDALRAASAEGIAPAVEGRIVNPRRGDGGHAPCPAPLR